MEIKVTSCADCKFKSSIDECSLLNIDVFYYWVDDKVHPSCPLKQQSITVKLLKNVN